MRPEPDMDDPRMIQAYNRLTAILEAHVGEEFNAAHMDRICREVTEHREAFRRDHDADFPVLVPFVLPSLRFIHFVRADADDTKIYNMLRNILVQLARRKILPPAQEIAMAVRLCWPNYRPPIEDWAADPLLEQRLQ